MTHTFETAARIPVPGRPMARHSRTVNDCRSAGPRSREQEQGRLAEQPQGRRQRQSTNKQIASDWISEEGDVNRGRGKEERAEERPGATSLG